LPESITTWGTGEKRFNTQDPRITNPALSWEQADDRKVRYPTKIAEDHKAGSIF